MAQYIYTDKIREWETNQPMRDKAFKYVLLDDDMNPVRWYVKKPRDLKGLRLKEVERKITAAPVHFKGSGFYKTDYTSYSSPK